MIDSLSTETTDKIVAPEKCSALKAPDGSCSNRVTCPRADGTCGINIYGARSTDKGRTCKKSCEAIGLGCVTGMEVRLAKVHRSTVNIRLTQVALKLSHFKIASKEVILPSLLFTGLQ